MTVSRPPLLRVGDEVEVGGAVHTVTGLSGSSARLCDVTGAEASMTLAELLSAPGFRMVTRPPAALPPQGLMDALPAEAADQALWWERHVVEVIAGVPPGAAAGTRPQPEYDPETRTLRQRELAKIGELAGLGRPVPLSTLQRLRLSYEKRGAWGLVDHRFAPRPGARTDKRVLEAIAQAVGEETDRSTGTVDRLRRRVEQILAGEHGIDPAAVMPARATFYRLAAQAASGKHTFGSARTRRSQAKTPAGPFGTVTAARPGEWTQIDSTPLDVRVVLDNGMTDRAELTWIIDIATRTIPAAVLRTSAKAADAALLLARAMTPEPMRPGWADALRMSRSVLPHRRLTDIDGRLADAAARPVIVPETIVCDHGSVCMSQAFRSACRAMGITLQPAHEGSHDCKALTPCRRQHSGVNARNGLWEVHFDPHDVTRVWVRDHLGDGGWILAPWTHLRAAPAPFGEQAWDHARKMLARRGQDPVTEAEIARAAAALLDKAEQGPPRGSEERRDRKAAARARAAAAAGPSVPEEAAQPAGQQDPPAWDDGEDDDGPLAEVIPLGIFDAREEAKKWW